MMTEKKTPTIDDYINSIVSKDRLNCWYNDVIKATIKDGGKVAILQGRVHQNDLSRFFNDD